MSALEVGLAVFGGCMAAVLVVIGIVQVIKWFKR